MHLKQGLKKLWINEEGGCMYCGIEGCIALTIAIISDNIYTQEQAFAELDRRLGNRKKRYKQNPEEITSLRELGMTARDIAGILGIKPSSLYSYMSRARRKGINI